MSTLYRSYFRYNGKKYEKTSTISQEDANYKARRYKEDLENGVIGISKNMTVRNWANEWLEIYKKPLLAEKQYKDYKRQIDNSIIPAIGTLRLVDVKDIHLQKILNSKSGLSETRIKMLYLTIRGIFRQAKISLLIIQDPSEHLRLPASTKGTHRSITDFEREHFLKAAANHHAGLMFKVMLYCGLRTGEVVALEWRDIDTKKKRFKITRALESGTDNLKLPKTNAGIREVPIPNELYDELIAVRRDPFEPIFLQEKGRVRHTHSSRCKAWESLKKQIDISMGAVYEKRKAKDGKMRLTKVLSVVAPDFVPYCLRHTYCTDLQDKGVPINIARYLMGHSDIRVTSGIYTHTTEQSIDDAANLINAVTSVVSKRSDNVETA